MSEETVKKSLELIALKGGENFIILTAEELLGELGQNLSQSELLSLFNNLKNTGYIHLKYNDGKSFCCCVTTRGKEFVENANSNVVEECKIQDKTPYFLIFMSAFFGGVLGGVILLFASIF